MHHFIIICEFNWSYSPETVKLGCDLCDLDLWPPTLTFCMDGTSVTGHNFIKISWWYDDGNIVKKLWRTDGRTDWTIHRAAWSQLTRIYIYMYIIYVYIIYILLHILVLTIWHFQIKFHISKLYLASHFTEVRSQGLIHNQSASV